MALNVNKGKTQEKKAASGTSQKTNQGQEKTTQNQNPFTGRPVFGMEGFGNVLGAGDSYVETLYSHVQSNLKNLEERFGKDRFFAFKMFKHNYGLNYSAIVVAEKIDGLVTGHILMIERTGEEPTPLIENIGGVRYELVRTPADALDNKYVQAAAKHLSDLMGVPMDSVVIADGTLIPNELDVENEANVKRVLRVALEAVHAEQEIRKGYSGLNIQDIIKADPRGRFVITTHLNSPDNVIFNDVGMPIRQDICVILSYKTNQNNNYQSVNQGADTEELVRVYGYVDFESIGPGGPGSVPTQRFLPNFIITGIRTEGYAPTPDFVLLGVASALSLNEDYGWLRAVQISANKREKVDLGDIGALNIEANIEGNQSGYGTKIDTKSKEFGVNEFHTFINSVVRPGLMISIDLPKAGPDTWFLSPFYHAKFSNSPGALGRIMKAADTLTNGVFSQNPTVNMFLGISNKIHGGYYKDKHNNVFDLRNVCNYLAVANHIAATNQPPALITQYTSTLYNETIPSDIRAAERLKFIKEITNNSVVIKQMYERVTFSTEFLTLLVKGLTQNGFRPINDNAGLTTEVFQRRVVPNFSAGVIDPNLRIMAGQDLFGSIHMPFNYNRQF